MRKIISMAIMSMPLLIGSLYSQTPFWDNNTFPNNKLFTNPAITAVGIGTATPRSMLEIYHRTDSAGIIINQGLAGSKRSFLRFDFDDTVAVGIFADGANERQLKIVNPNQNFSGWLTRLTIDTTGKVGVGDSTPVSLFTVAEGDKFQVDNNGDMVKIKNVTYSWPTTQGAASSVLTNNGSGTLSWAAPGSVSSAWTITGNAGTSPGTNFIGTTDNTDWVIKTNNTERMRVLSGGNVGIGSSSASSKLFVSGNAEISSGNYLKLNGFVNTADIVIDIGNYDIYADNTGTGSDATRIWWNTPDQGDFIIGPRSSANFL